MMHRFAMDQKHTQTYSLFNECASQVHKYLSLGGGGKYASLWSRNVVLTWSPDDVEDYSKSIISKTRKLGSVGVQIVGAGTIW